MLNNHSVSSVNLSNTFLNTFIMLTSEMFCGSRFCNLIMHICLLEMFLKQVADNLMECHFTLLFVVIVDIFIFILCMPFITYRSLASPIISSMS